MNTNFMNSDVNVQDLTSFRKDPRHQGGPLQVNDLIFSWIVVLYHTYTSVHVIYAQSIPSSR